MLPIAAGGAAAGGGAAATAGASGAAAEGAMGATAARAGATSSLSGRLGRLGEFLSINPGSSSSKDSGSVSFKASTPSNPSDNPGGGNWGALNRLMCFGMGCKTRS